MDKKPVLFTITVTKSQDDTVEESSPNELSLSSEYRPEAHLDATDWIDFFNVSNRTGLPKHVFIPMLR